MEREIADVQRCYEQLLVKFADSDAWYYMKFDELRGLKLNGNVVKKRTRTWFEGEDRETANGDYHEQ